MGLLEAQVHDRLKEYQKTQPQVPWPHGLTMGRLVARALRLRRSTLIQTGCSLNVYGPSYLLPCLLSPHPVTVVTPGDRADFLTSQVLPALQNALDPFPLPTFLTPAQWLAQDHSPPTDPPLTLIDPGESLEQWTRQWLSHTLPLAALLAHAPGRRLAQSLARRPPNPYGCYPLNADEQTYLQGAIALALPHHPPDSPLHRFWQFWHCYPDNHLLWAEGPLGDRSGHSLQIHLAPVNLHPWLVPRWQTLTQPPGVLILIGSFLDATQEALPYRRTLGLPDSLLCLKFKPPLPQDSLTLYLPDQLPLPNTPTFAPALTQAIQTLLEQWLAVSPQGFAVILLDDLPLKTQIGSQLAAQWGSLVKVEPLHPSRTGILVAGWRYWGDAGGTLRARQSEFPPPQLLILGTLPIPSLEHPLVASRVQYHKRHHQDWFRGYLLPTALNDLQQATLPLRETGGLLAILDNRVNSRSYGREVLRALAPYAITPYFDPYFFTELCGEN